MFNSTRISLTISIILSAVVCLSVSAADLPKSVLPSQEPTLFEDTPREPKVIVNPKPTKDDKLGATQVQDPEATSDESPFPDLISPPLHKSTFKVKPVKGRKTMALALGGGGARGAAHIGVLRVFEEEKIPIDYIVGNSMGAIVGGLYSAGVQLKTLEGVGKKGGLKKYYVPSILRCVVLMPLAKLVQPFRTHKLAGLVSGDKFENYLETLIPEDANDMSKLKIPFSAVAANLIDGKAYRISEGKLSTAIRASASLSPFLRPVRIDDKIYVDGGVRANLPASSARDTGADVVIAVLVDEPLRELPEKNFRKFKGIALRLSDIILAVTDEHQLQFADVVINPDVSGISILTDDPASVEKAIEEGEKAARKAIRAIRTKMGLPASSHLVKSGASQ